MNNALSINNNYSKSFYYNLEINKFIETLFNKFYIINKIVIKKKLNHLLIYVYFNLGKNKISTKTSLIKKSEIKLKIDNYLNSLNLNLKSKLFIVQSNMKVLKASKLYSKMIRLYKNKRRHPLFYLINIVIVSKNVKLLNLLLEQNLKKTRRHKQYLISFNKFIGEIMNCYNCFIGYKIQLKGRLNGAERSQKVCINKGIVPLTSFVVDTNYNFKEFLTLYGICSIKSWLIFKKN